VVVVGVVVVVVGKEDGYISNFRVLTPGDAKILLADVVLLGLVVCIVC
jgi:hypothetical protein